VAFVAFVLLFLDLEEEVAFIAHVLQTESRSCFGDPMSLVLLGSLPSEVEERTNIFADLQREGGRADQTPHMPHMPQILMV